MSAHRLEYLAQLRLALPILGGQLAQTANGFVDTMMAGRVGAEDLAAVAVGASIWVPLFLFMTGVLMSATPILSRHLGGDLSTARIQRRLLFRSYPILADHRLAPRQRLLMCSVT